MVVRILGRLLDDAIDEALTVFDDGDLADPYIFRKTGELRRVREVGIHVKGNLDRTNAKFVNLCDDGSIGIVHAVEDDAGCLAAGDLLENIFSVVAGEIKFQPQVEGKQ